jgi:hypothetical protein
MKHTALKRKTPLKAKKPMERKPFRKPTVQEMLSKGIVHRSSTLAAKPSEKTLALEAADIAFSRFIRVDSANDQGVYQCFICGEPVVWEDGVAMHCEPRLGMVGRYSRINVQPGCFSCNNKPLGDRAAFRTMLDLRFGTGTAERNEYYCKSTQHIGAEDLRKLAAKFNRATAAIRKLKGI